MCELLFEVSNHERRWRQWWLPSKSYQGVSESFGIHFERWQPRHKHGEFQNGSSTLIILKDRLHDIINKQTTKRSKHAPKAKPTPGKENRAAKVARSAKGKGKRIKLQKKHLLYSGPRLKKLYCDNCKELGQTGQGLVDSEMTHEVKAGTPLANVWDHIKAKFPWYEHLNKLFGSNPAINRSAVANSQTVVNTSILDATPKNQRRNKSLHTRPAPSEDSSSSSNSQSESEASAGGNNSDVNPNDNDDGNDDNKSCEAPSQNSSPTPAAVHTPCCAGGQSNSNSLSEPQSTLQGAKRKASIMEQITEMANVDRSQRLKIVEVKQKEKKLVTPGQNTPPRTSSR
ncbi:hypothetical protein B0H34DRAFT_821284 [Crassisporium funariophilum]|nr:hypothetical protein B0H34DRAFT_821284 [Crassisporium funariophilum]